MRLVPARPTRADARHFAALAQIAADNLFSELFGGRAAPLLEGMFLRADNPNSYLRCAFLRSDDAVAGMIHALPARTMQAQRDRELLLMLWLARWQLPRFLVVMLLLRELLGFLGDKLADDDFYIAFVAIYPSFRGRGLSKRLLAHAEALARRHDCARLCLDVDAANQVAIAAYQRVGFQRVDVSPAVNLGGETAQMLRMAKALNGPAAAK